MNVNFLLSFISTLKNSTSSIFHTVNFSNFLAVFSTNLSNITDTIFTFFANFFYIVAKWMLMTVDILFSYVQELSGLNMDFSSLDSLVSEDSDLVFKLLLSSKNIIIPIIRSLIVLAIFLIIFFSIISIVKSQFTSLKDNKGADLADVLRKAIKSFLLLVLTPMISIVGIIASDLILQTLYNATNYSASYSLGTKIFSVSSTSANCFRIYAKNGLRIPITCDFTDDEAILKYYEEHPLTSEFAEYITSSNSAIYSTYLMFNNGNFISYESMNSILYSDTEVQNQNEAYYLAYDVDLAKINSSSFTAQYNKIESYAEEYYVMADVIDYCMETSNTVYYRTIEDVLQSIYDLQISDDTYKNKLMWDVVNLFQIKFLKEDGLEITIDVSNYSDLLTIYNSGSWVALRYSSDYYSDDSNGEPTLKMQIEYTHVRNAIDEQYGAKFLIAVERTLNFGGETYSYYYPLTRGYSQNSTTSFDSSYIAKGQIISAKGIFYNSEYPTAIRKTGDTTIHNRAYATVEFYRDNIETVASGQSSSLFGLDWEQDQTSSGVAGVFQKIGNFFKTLFDPSSLIPKFDVDTDAIKASYQKATTVANTLENGRLHVGYMMDSGGFISSWINGKVTGSIYGLNIANLYKVTKINFLVLLAGTLILIKVTFSVIFALIERAYDLFLIIMFYPTACATLPLSDEGYKKWLSSYFGRLFATYGFILSINFVFLLFPIIESIEFFSVQDVGTSQIIRRIGSLFFLFTNVNGITKMLNLIVSILFELVALTLIQTVPETISSIIGKGQDVTKSQALQTAVGNAKSALNVIGGPKRWVGNAVKKGKQAATAMAHPVRTATEFVKKHGPGSAIISAGLDRHYLSKKKKEQKEALKDLKEKAKRESKEDGQTEQKTKEKEVQEALDKYTKAQDAYTKALKDPQGTRKADHDQKKQEDKENKELEKQGIKSREDGDESSGGEADKDEPNYSDMTKRELKKAKKEAKKKVKNINKAARKQRGLKFWQKKSNNMTDAQQEALEHQKAIIEKANAEIKTIKGEKKGDKEIKGLDKKASSGQILTEEEQKKLDDFKANGKSIDSRKQRSKERKANQKQQKKIDAENKKIEEKRKEQDHKDYLKFTKNGGKYSRGQKSRIKQITKEMNSIEKDLKKTGFDQDISKMSSSQITALMNSDGITNEQKQLLDEYKYNKNKISQLADIKESEINGQQTRREKTSMDKTSKHLKRAGKKYSKVNQEETQAEIDRLDAEIDKINNEGIDSSNFKKQQEMILQRRKLQGLLAETKDWQDKSANPQQTKDDRKAQKRSDKENKKIDEEAISLIKNVGVDIMVKDRNGKNVRRRSNDIYDMATFERAKEIVRAKYENKKK
jgi:hypothetical protein